MAADPEDGFSQKSPMVDTMFLAVSLNRLHGFDPAVFDFRTFGFDAEQKHQIGYGVGSFERPPDTSHKLHVVQYG